MIDLPLFSHDEMKNSAMNVFGYQVFRVKG